MPRKSKSDIENLPRHQKARLEQWLFDDSPRLTYKQASEQFYQDFEVRLSPSSLGVWWQEKALDRELHKIVIASQNSTEVTTYFRQNKDQAFEALMGLIGQAAFNQKLKGEDLSIGTLKDLVDIAAIGLKAKADTKKAEQKDREIELNAKRVELLERKANQSDAAKGVLEDKELTESQRAARLREIFGTS